MFHWWNGPSRKDLLCEVERLKIVAAEIERARELELAYGPIAQLDARRQDVQKQFDDLSRQYERKRSIFEAYGPVDKLNAIQSELKQQNSALQVKIFAAHKHYDRLIILSGGLEADIEWQELGVYKPTFDFNSSETYQAAIEENIERQKVMIKNKMAVICSIQWTVNNSKRAGDAMVGQDIRLTLRAFNNECEAILGRVTWRNLEASRERMRRAFDQISKLKTSKQIEITPDYLKLKLEQLTLVYEQSAKLQEEKEEHRRAREMERENARAQREIEEALRRTEEEEIRYGQALERARIELQSTDSVALRARIADLEAKLERARAERQRAVSMAQITRSGYVYIISNIGSFGEQVFKVGMTRRIDPMERVYELGDASVPFGFDVHAMIWTEDAPGLERALHARLDGCRVNRINYRREFFACDMATMRQTLAACVPEAPFAETAEAEQFRRSRASKSVAVSHNEGAVCLDAA